MLVASSEMPELLGLCDRIVVMRGGRSGRGIVPAASTSTSAAWQSADGESGGRMTERETAAPDVAALPRRPRRACDPLALVVRFQSVIGLVLVLSAASIFSPSRHGQIIFLSPDNIANIIRAISETGIIALGMTFVIITAGIDLSVGAMLGLSA